MKLMQDDKTWLHVQNDVHILLLQPLDLHCAESTLHHERNVREEQHHICGANKQ